MSEAELTTDARQLHESQLVHHMAQADAIMQHLDRTWWLGDDVGEQLALLRRHLVASLEALDAYTGARAAAQTPADGA